MFRTIIFLTLLIMFIGCKDDSTSPNVDPKISVASIEQLPNSTYGFHAKWSPDGKKLVYTIRPNNIPKLMLYDVDKKTSSLVLEDMDGDLTITWSPDSKKIVFDAYDQNQVSQLWIKDLESGVTNKLTNYARPSFGPEWILNSNKILFAYSNKLCILDIDKKTLESVINSENGMAGHWDINNSRIVFCIDPNHNNNSSIYTILSDGSEKTKITTYDKRNSRPRWSPDGNFIVYEKSDHSSTDLMIYETESKEHYNITTGGSGSFPDWSPDGKAIVYTNNNQLFIMHLEIN